MNHSSPTRLSSEFRHRPPRPAGQGPRLLLLRILTPSLEALRLKPSPSRGGLGGDGFPHRPMGIQKPVGAHWGATAAAWRFGRAPVRSYAESGRRSEEHTSALQSLMRISYAVFCLKK